MAIRAFAMQPGAARSTLRSRLWPIPPLWAAPQTGSILGIEPTEPDLRNAAQVVILLLNADLLTDEDPLPLIAPGLPGTRGTLKRVDAPPGPEIKVYAIEVRAVAGGQINSVGAVACRIRR